MEAGCNTYSLRALDRDAAFARCAELGLTAVELWGGHAPYRDGAVRPRDVLRHAASHGLTLRAYCIGGLFGLPRAEVDDRLERACWFARELGVDLVVTILDPGVVGGADALARRCGVRIALENHWYTALARPADVHRAVARCSPAVGAAIDVGHFAFLGYEAGGAARLLGTRAFHVHVKAVRRRPAIARAVQRARRRFRMEAAPPGDRDGLDGLVRTLAAGRYAGLLAIEDEAGGGDGRMLPQWRDRVRTLLGQAAGDAEERVHA